jgi:tetratricopeptide (TPR) repeat protein
MSETELPKGHRLHLGIAEGGKLHALKGEHGQALTCYREAIRMAVNTGAPEVFFRHYMECTLESLEKMGSFPEVIAYADRAIEHYAAITPTSDEQRALIRADLVSIHQRRGAVLLKSGRVDEARAALEKATALAREAPAIALPLAEALLGWIVRGFHVDAHRILTEQEAKRYFSVRPDTVDRALAIPLPKMEVRDHG